MCDFLPLPHSTANGGATIGDGAHDTAFKDGELALADAGGVGLVGLLQGEGLDDDVADLGWLIVGAELGRAADLAVNPSDELLLGRGGLDNWSAGLGVRSHGRGLGD